MFIVTLVSLNQLMEDCKGLWRYRRPLDMREDASNHIELEASDQPWDVDRNWPRWWICRSHASRLWGLADTPRCLSNRPTNLSHCDPIVHPASVSFGSSTLAAIMTGIVITEMESFPCRCEYLAQPFWRWPNIQEVWLLASPSIRASLTHAYFAFINITLNKHTNMQPQWYPLKFA